MAKIEVKDGKFLDALNEFLARLLAEKLVDGLLVPQKIPSGESVVQTLIEDPASLKEVDPVAPVLPINSARIVSKLTTGVPGILSSGIEAAGKSLGVLLRPCEIRALIELTKLKQAQIENLLIIGIDCWGTYSVSDYADKAKQLGKDGSVTEEFLKAVKSEKEILELRSACQICQFPTPKNADLEIGLVGFDLDKEFSIQAQSEKGKNILEALKMEGAAEGRQRQQAVSKLLAKRKEDEVKKEEIDFLGLISSVCIGCQNCRAVCPICYCRQCIFEGPIFEYESHKYLAWAKRKGLLKMPPDTLLFHLTRMSHVSSSCVACGQCEAACPNKIPLGKVYHYLASEVQKMLEYEAGRKLEEELPLSTFREEELKVIET